MELSIKTKNSQEIIEYLLDSKRELQKEIKNDIHTEEFQKALSILRAKKQKNKS